MIEKRTVLNQIEVLPSGIVQVRFAKQLVEDGKVIAHEWHRTAIEPGVDVHAQMRAVNAHLVQIGAVPVAEYADLTAHVSLAHTPEKVAAFRAAAEDRARAAGKPAP